MGRESNIMALLEEFNSRYGYVCIDEEIVMLFIAETNDSLHNVDMLYDWVLSNNMAYEVVE